jgi:hypothetical protein
MAPPIPWNGFSRNHPVGETPLRIDLEAAEDRHVDMASSNQPKRHGAVEGASTG